MLEVIGGILGGLGGLFGKKSKSNESFEKHSEVTTEAENQDLSPELLKMLEGLFLGNVGSGNFEQAGDAMSTRLDQIMAQTKQPSFDVGGFAKGITEQATAGAQLDLESQINNILSTSGSSESGNSMSALLANRLRNTTAANLAGISAEATATGEGIRQSQEKLATESIMGLSGGLSDQILSLIQSTRGASNKGKSKSIEDTKGKGSMSGSSRGNPFQGFADVFGAFNDARGDA